MRVLVFGDSISYGVWDVDGGWVQRLRCSYDKLFIRDVKSDYHDFYNLSISGENSSGITKRIEHEIEARSWPGTPFVIVVAIGTNDSGQSGQHIELAQYRENLQKIIASARKFTDKLLFVGLPSVDEKLTKPWFVDEAVSFTNADLQTYEQAVREICAAENIPFVPIFEKLQAGQAKQNLLPDGLHPNAAGHGLIVDLVRPEIDKLLQ